LQLGSKFSAVPASFFMGRGKDEPKRSANTKFDTDIRPSDLNIPVDEQNRLIKESEILKMVAPEVEEDSDDDEGYDVADHIFNAIVLIIPATSLFVMMDL
jgi:hypothetical protein